MKTELIETWRVFVTRLAHVAAIGAVIGTGIILGAMVMGAAIASLVGTMNLVAHLFGIRIV